MSGISETDPSCDGACATSGSGISAEEGSLISVHTIDATSSIVKYLFRTRAEKQSDIRRHAGCTKSLLTDKLSGSFGRSPVSHILSQAPSSSDWTGNISTIMPVSPDPCLPPACRGRSYNNVPCLERPEAFQGTPVPPLALFGTAEITQIGATLLAICGVLMTPIGRTLALIVWAYALLSFVINDQIKVLLFRKIHPYS